MTGFHDWLENQRFGTVLTAFVVALLALGGATAVRIFTEIGWPLSWAGAIAGITLYALGWLWLHVEADPEVAAKFQMRDRVAPAQRRLAVIMGGALFAVALITSRNVVPEAGQGLIGTLVVAGVLAGIWLWPLTDAEYDDLVAQEEERQAAALEAQEAAADAEAEADEFAEEEPSPSRRRRRHRGGHDGGTVPTDTTDDGGGDGGAY